MPSFRGGIEGLIGFLRGKREGEDVARERRRQEEIDALNAKNIKQQLEIRAAEFDQWQKDLARTARNQVVNDLLAAGVPWTSIPDSVIKGSDYKFPEAPEAIPEKATKIAPYITYGPGDLGLSPETAPELFTPGGRPKAGTIVGGFQERTIEPTAIDKLREMMRPSVQVRESIPGVSAQEQLPPGMALSQGGEFMVPEPPPTEAQKYRDIKEATDYEKMQNDIKTFAPMVGSMLMGGMGDADVEATLSSLGVATNPQTIVAIGRGLMEGAIAEGKANSEAEWNRYVNEKILDADLRIKELGYASDLRKSEDFFKNELENPYVGGGNGGGAMIAYKQAGGYKPYDRSNPVPYTDRSNNILAANWNEYWAQGLRDAGFTPYKTNNLPQKGGGEAMGMAIEGDPVQAAIFLLSQPDGGKGKPSAFWWYKNSEKHPLLANVASPQEFASLPYSQKYAIVKQIYARESGRNLDDTYSPGTQGMRLKDLNQLKKDIEDGDKEFQSLMTKYNTALSALRTAKGAAIPDPDVIAKAEAYRKSIITLMRQKAKALDELGAKLNPPEMQSLNIWWPTPQNMGQRFQIPYQGKAPQTYQDLVSLLESSPDVEVAGGGGAVSSTGVSLE